ncbi:MAG: hypothetical protein DRJ10_14765 [Bacteroidetes bacterium]|nr:MAG: hypothetical protein DRJ10_14765 [Bacteroidota bacterium]
MSGFYGIYSLEQNHPEKVYQHFYSYKFDNIVNEESRNGHFTFGRSVLDKFMDDRVLWEDARFVVLFEGVCYNNPLPIPEFIIDLYKQHPDCLAKDIDGHFAGLIFDKTQNKLILFNDHLASKSIYYYLDPQRSFFIFSSELKVVAKMLDFFKIPKSYNLPGIYSFLAFGHYLGEHTSIKEIKRLSFASNYLFDANNFKITYSRYFNYEKAQDFSLNKHTILDNIDNLLLKSVKKEWNKDDEYKYDHYALLSGGLDSRVNILLAKEMGWDSIHAITFAESKSSDEKIAKQIVEKNSFKHTFQALDNGEYLSKNIEEYVLANDGMVSLLGSSHGYYTLSKIDHSQYGLVHTGQIGDLLFGSYSFKVKDFKTRVLNELNFEGSSLKDKFDQFEEVLSPYQYLTYEQFVYEQKAINGTLNGDRTLSHFADLASPFYDKDLIKFCLTIPDIFKQNEAIYIEWMNKYHPKLTMYKWEKAGVKPSNVLKVKTGVFIKNSKVALKRKMGIHSGMNPFEKWAKSNSLIMLNLDNVYKSNLEHITVPSLRKDLTDLYTGTSNILQKMKVVTLLITLKIHFQ